jgi:hypothetical protein
MAAVAEGYTHRNSLGTPVCYVNRSLLATAVSHFLTVTHNPG